MTDQKRQSQPILSVDFLTALTLDECRARLLQTDPAKGQHVSVWDDHSFTVHCCASDTAKAVARFWGTLEPRERGTWVWGTSIEDAAGRPEWPSRRTTALMIALIVLAAAALTLNNPQLLLIALLLVAASILWRFWTWRRRHFEALQVIRWVWETLYIPIKEKDKEPRPDEIQS